MTYTETLGALATSTEVPLTALYARYEAGTLTLDQFRALAVAVLLRAGARGVSMADVALAAFLTSARGEVVSPLGLALPVDAADHYRTAVAGLTAAAFTLEDALTTGRAETLATSQDAYSAGMRSHGVEAWTRVLNGGACELCRDLAGAVLPASADMYHHKGCGCTQQPITREAAA